MLSFFLLFFWIFFKLIILFSKPLRAGKVMLSLFIFVFSHLVIFFLIFGYVMKVVVGRVDFNVVKFILWKKMFLE